MSEFKVGQYIVQLCPSGSKYLLQNHIYKQSYNSQTLDTKKDSLGGETSSSHVFYNKSETWRYPTLEEIAQYERLGKPYDVTTLKKHNPMNVKYGVGAHVVCVGSGHSSAAGVKSAGWKENLCLKVTRINSVSNNPDVLWFENHNGGVYEDCVRPATAEEIKEYFKKGGPYDVTTLKKEENLVGRYLRALVDNPQRSAGKKGDYYKIIRTDSITLTVNHSTLKGQYGASIDELDKSWKLMPEGFIPQESTEAVKNPHKYKAGDYVWCQPEPGAGMWDKQILKLHSLSTFSNVTGLRITDHPHFEVHPKEYLGPVRISEKSIISKASQAEIDSLKEPLEYNSLSMHAAKSLIAEAKRRYPPGTVYISLGSRAHCTVEQQSFTFSGPNIILGELGKGILYGDGIWAETVTPAKVYTPNPEELGWSSRTVIPINSLQHQEPVLLKSKSKKVQLISVNTNN